MSAAQTNREIAKRFTSMGRDLGRSRNGAEEKCHECVSGVQLNGLREVLHLFERWMVTRLQAGRCLQVEGLPPQVGGYELSSLACGRLSGIERGRRGYTVAPPGWMVLPFRFASAEGTVLGK